MDVMQETCKVSYIMAKKITLDSVVDA